MYSFPRLAARFGAERLLVIGGLAFAARSGLAALAVDPALLVAIAPLEGIGFAGTFVGGVTVLAARAPAGTGGTAQGLLTGSAGLATILGATLGGAIAAAVGIPGLFVICAIVSVLGAAILAVAVARPAHRAVSPAR
jgi:MFS family permease